MGDPVSADYHLIFRRLYLIFNFLPLPNILICLAKHLETWSEWRKATIQRDFTDGAQRFHRLPSLSRSVSLPASQSHLPASPAVRIKIRTSGKKGSILLDRKQSCFFSLIRFSIANQDFHSSGGCSSQRRAGSDLFHRRNANSTIAKVFLSVFSEFSSLAGLRSLVTSNLQLAEDQT